MAKIVYVGKNAEGKEDNLYNSGVVWDAPGDVQEVRDPEIVAKMLVHTDTWVLADGEELGLESLGDAETDDQVRARKLKEAERKEIEEQEQLEVETMSIERMDKAALVTYAKRTFGLQLSPKLTLQDMRTQVTRQAKRATSVQKIDKAPARAKPAAKSKSAKKK